MKRDDQQRQNRGGIHNQESSPLLDSHRNTQFYRYTDEEQEGHDVVIREVHYLRPRRQKKRFIWDRCFRFFLKKAVIIGLLYATFGFVTWGSHWSGWPIPGRRCHTTASLTKAFHFYDVKGFRLYNRIKPNGNQADRYHIAEARIEILPGHDQEEDVLVEISFNTTDEKLFDQLIIEQSSDSVTLDFPKKTDEPSQPHTPRSCIRTVTKVYIRPGLRLNYFVVESIINSIHIPQIIDFRVLSTTQIKLAVGSLHATPFFDSRFTYISSDVGSIHGSFPLQDDLFLNARVGSIHAEIVPRPALRGSTEPASLVATTSTGSVHMSYPAPHVEVPERFYQTHVSSNSGSVHGTYLHGFNTTLATSSGSIHATIVPLAPHETSKERDSYLTTTSHAGSVHLTVLDAFHTTNYPIPRRDVAALGELYANHVTQSGSVTVKYPRSWEGTLRAASNLGSVSAAGKGLDIVRREKKGLGWRVLARKGGKAGETLCKSTTGSVRFLVAGD